MSVSQRASAHDEPGAARLIDHPGGSSSLHFTFRADELGIRVEAAPLHALLAGEEMTLGIGEHQFRYRTDGVWKRVADAA